MALANEVFKASIGVIVGCGGRQAKENVSKRKDLTNLLLEPVAMKSNERTERLRVVCRGRP